MAKTKLHWKFILGVLTLALIGWVTAAHAAPTLQISDGITTVTVADNAAGDLNPLVGVITFAGPFPGLLVTVDTGVSKPVMPFPGAIDLNAVQVTTGPKDFTIKFSDTDFVFPTGSTHLIMSLGGTLSAPVGSTITFDGYEDDTNTLFGTGGLHVGPATFGPGAFSTQQGFGSFVTGPYSLTEVVTIHLTGPSSTSFDTELRVVPEPATLTLLGLGVLGVGACAWRRRKGEGTPTR
ncbi:MAG TPA: PEP-CTERM sorting domain-containing protein [Methylomirabilota bacterium]|nr:PEP-CTERM sorting domain-containing protein [Methylomirabilota bacterium]